GGVASGATRVGRAGCGSRRAPARAVLTGRMSRRAASRWKRWRLVLLLSLGGLELLEPFTSLALGGLLAVEKDAGEGGHIGHSYRPGEPGEAQPAEERCQEEA